MINPTDGPRVGAWRRAALGFCLTVIWAVSTNAGM